MALQNSLFKPLGLAALLAVGFSVVIAVGVGCGIGVVVHLVEMREYEGLAQKEPAAGDGKEKEFVEEQFFLRSDGTPLISRVTRRTDRIVDVQRFTLEGREVPLEPAELEAWKSYRGSLQCLYVPAEVPSLDQFASRADVFNRVRELPIYGPRYEGWFFLHDGRRNGRGYFVGYEAKTNHCLGYIGKNGWQTTRPTREEQLPIDGRGGAYGGASIVQGRTFQPPAWEPDAFPKVLYSEGTILMISGGRLHEVDLEKKTVSPLGNVKGLLTLSLTGRFEPNSMDQAGGIGDAGQMRTDEYIVARTAEHVRLLDPWGREVRSYRLPKEFLEKSFRFYETAQHQAVLTRERLLPDYKRIVEITCIDTSGKVLCRKDLDWFGPLPWLYTPQTLAWMYSLVHPAPTVIMLRASVFDPLNFHLDREKVGFFQIMIRLIRGSWPSLLVVSLLSLALAAWCYRRHRRHALPGAVVWAAFVFLFGLPGFLAYRFHRRWPVLESCPACGTATPRDRLACAACNTGFPPPPRNGTEVFA